MHLLLVVFALGFIHMASAGLLPLPCSATTTIPVPIVTIPCVAYKYTTTTSLIPITAPPETTRVTTTTTTFSPTNIPCLSSATTLPPRFYLFPREDADAFHKDTTIELESRQLLPPIDLPPLLPLPDLLCPPLPPAVVLPPLVPDLPCVAVPNPVKFSTTTLTVTVTLPKLTLIRPSPVTSTLTRTAVLPTPSSYSGLRYYQYTNNYFYNGANRAGYGGGGYTTSDWANNTAYEFTNMTNNVNFETPNWPNGPPVLQLPGMPAPRNAEHWTVLFQGYLHARQAGNWTIGYLEPPVDNAGYTWVGPKAYREFADGNNDADYTEFNTPPPDRALVGLAAGEFVPVTVIVANGGGPMRHRLSAVGPDGVVYGGLGPDLFVGGCDGGEFVP